jgi:UDP-glucuronate decarboxylase
MLELARKVLDLTGSRSQIVNASAARRRPAPARPDIAIARERWSWEPKVPLEQDC